MSICKYCGQKAGLFKSVHKDCVFVWETGKSTIVNTINEAINEGADFEKYETKINILALNSYIQSDELPELYSQGFDKKAR